MSLPYSLRLLCLCMAAFFLLHLALALIVSCAAPLAIRAASRFRPRAAAAFLLTLRLLPASLAAFAVASLCAPSFLLLEPEATPEDVGFACLAAAALGIAICALSMLRGVRAWVRSTMYLRGCQRNSTVRRIAGEPAPVWIVEGATPFLALAGIWKPRIVVSRPVVNALSAEQLSAAFRHERAHATSLDNLKRLGLLLAPGIFPGFRGFAALEHAWTRFAEWAADDSAVAANQLRSFSLAAALVRVARLGPLANPSPLATSLLADGRDLSARVERLLQAAPAAEAGTRKFGILAAAFVLPGMMITAAIVAILQPAPLHFTHELLERLVH